jgi:hypothetical protein
MRRMTVCWCWIRRWCATAVVAAFLLLSAAPSAVTVTAWGMFYEAPTFRTVPTTKARPDPLLVAARRRIMNARRMGMMLPPPSSRITRLWSRSSNNEVVTTNWCSNSDEQQQQQELTSSEKVTEATLRSVTLWNVQKYKGTQERSAESAS